MSEHVQNLSHEQTMFAVLIQRHSSLNKYWDWQTRVCDLKSLKKAMKTMSTGERIMTKFYVGLWNGDNVLDFDLLEAAHHLDGGNLRIIKEWMDYPFWP